MAKTYKVAVLGATGMVGQRFMTLLADHPWFKVTELVASERSAGKRYADAAHWVLNEPIPQRFRDIEVKTTDADLDVDLCFSAIPAGIAGPVETELAKRGYHVFTNARDHRWDANVPLLVPEVNPDHAELVRRQGTDGFLVSNGNCSTIVMVMTLKPLVDAFGVRKVFVSTYQAISGAGYPGVPSLDILGNVMPHVQSEEDKMEREPLKMLGRLTPAGIENADLKISAACARVPVEESHTETVSVELARDASPEEVARVFAEWRARPQELKLPSAPARPLVVTDDPARPQPRKDWPAERGMAVTVGRIRRDPLLTVKYFLTGSNTVRGAAGSNVLGAELLAAEGYLG